MVNVISLQTGRTISNLINRNIQQDEAAILQCLLFNFFPQTYNFQLMLRFSNLLRTNLKMTRISRAGLPGWNRPDPPPSASVQIQTEMTQQEIIFTFGDRNMPQFILTQPEIYMGDHFKEGAPMFFKGWAFFLGVAATFGLVTYIMRPLRSEPTANWNHWNYIYDLYKKRADEKYFYNWGKQNPFGIEVYPDSFPAVPHKKVDIIQVLEDKKNSVRKAETVFSQTKSYLLKVKEQCAAKAAESNPSH